MLFYEFLGLFLTAAKPPIAQKPPIFKRPAVNNSQDVASNKPSVPPKVTLGSPPKTSPKPFKSTCKASEQPDRDNIYDEVYHEETTEFERSSVSHDRTPSRKLEKIHCQIKTKMIRTLRSILTEWIGEYRGNAVFRIESNDLQNLISLSY